MVEIVEDSVKENAREIEICVQQFGCFQYCTRHLSSVLSFGYNFLMKFAI